MALVIANRVRFLCDLSTSDLSGIRCVQVARRAKSGGSVSRVRSVYTQVSDVALWRVCLPSSDSLLVFSRVVKVQGTQPYTHDTYV